MAWYMLKPDAISGDVGQFSHELWYKDERFIAWRGGGERERAKLLAQDY
jgi:hypothetical protein